MEDQPPITDKEFYLLDMRKILRKRKSNYELQSSYWYYFDINEHLNFNK